MEAVGACLLSPRTSRTKIILTGRKRMHMNTKYLVVRTLCLPPSTFMSSNLITYINYQGRMARIYCGLSDEQAIYLGAMHQKSSSFSHEITYREEVKYIIFDTVNTGERYNEEPRDWQNFFAITRFHYIKVLFYVLLLTG